MVAVHTVILYLGFSKRFLNCLVRNYSICPLHNWHVVNFNRRFPRCYMGANIVSLQDIVLETILCGNIVLGALLLKLLNYCLLALKQCLHLFIGGNNTKRNKEAHWLSFYNVLTFQLSNLVINVIKIFTNLLNWHAVSYSEK